MPSAGDLVNALMGYFTPDPNLSAPYRPGFNGPSWMDQAAAIENISDPNQRMAAKTDFASGMVGPQALTTRIANPIRAFHGSPYDFNAFDTSKIGTGEGAQAYGHGLYFAENPNVADTYKTSNAGLTKATSLTPQERYEQDLIWQAKKYYNESGGDYDRALDRANYDKTFSSARPDPGPARKQWDADYLAIKSHLRAAKNGVPTWGHGYEVAIHADPQQFLDWDKPLSEQGLQGAATGEDLFREMENRLGAHLYPEKISKALSQAGFSGIQYLDQGSRTAGQGTRNYVVFDPSIVEIMRKYGFIPPLAGAAAYGASQGQQQ